MGLKSTCIQLSLASLLIAFIVIEQRRQYAQAASPTPLPTVKQTLMPTDLRRNTEIERISGAQINDVDSATKEIHNGVATTTLRPTQYPTPESARTHENEVESIDPGYFSAEQLPNSPAWTTFLTNINDETPDAIENKNELPRPIAGDAEAAPMQVVKSNPDRLDLFLKRGEPINLSDLVPRTYVMEKAEWLNPEQTSCVIIRLPGRGSFLVGTGGSAAVLRVTLQHSTSRDSDWVIDYAVKVIAQKEIFATKNKEQVSQLLSTLAIAYPECRLEILGDGKGLLVKGVCDSESSAREILSCIRKIFLCPIRDELTVSKGSRSMAKSSFAL